MSNEIAPKIAYKNTSDRHGNNEFVKHTKFPTRYGKFRPRFETKKSNNIQIFANPIGLAIPPCYGRSAPSDFESHPQFSLAESKRPSWQHEAFALSQWELRMWFEIRGGWTAVTRRYRQAYGIGKNLNIIRFFRFKMRAKLTVADESRRKFSVFYESVVSVAIRCIFMRFSERFRVTLVADQTWSLQPSIFICI